MTIIIFIAVLAILILVHETGHFLVAKKAGVKVPEFGLGFPPKIFGKKIGETEYTLNLIPFGGFVKIIGENAEEDISPKDYPRSFMAQSRPVQAMIISAGVIFNWIFAWLLLSGSLIAGAPASLDTVSREAFVTEPVLTVTSVLEGAPADVAGLRAGDTILSLVSGQDGIQDIQNTEIARDFIKEHGTENISVLYRRVNEEPRLINIIPQEGIIPDRAALGITMDVIGIAKYAPHKALIEGAKQTVLLTGAIAAGLWDFVSNAIIGNADIKNIAGPVGIAGLVGEASSLGFVYLVTFTALISINLAIINLIPFPALDGGRLLFIIIESIKRSPVSPKITQIANAVGFALLLILMVVVTFNDIARIITG